MEQPKEMCCFCLSASKLSLLDPFTKNEGDLTNFEKISCLSDLSKLLNENSNSNFKLCTSCCDSIDMVYQFNLTCLHNIQIFLSQKEDIKTEPEIDQLNSAIESTEDQNWEKSKIFIKEENEAVATEPQSETIATKIGTRNPKTKRVAKKIVKKSKKSRKEIQKLGKEEFYSDHWGSDGRDFDNSDSGSEKNFSELIEEVSKKGLGKTKSPKVVRSGENREFSCEICGKTFSNRKYVTTHRSRVHLDTKSYICDFCGKTFKCKLSLTYHINTHTGEKPYECDTCKAAFTCRTTLHIHKRIHTDFKPFTCDVCGKQFRTMGNLSKHKLRHTGVRPFECNLCEKTFKDKRTLDLHKLSHTGEKPCPCEICGKSFLDKSTVKRHIRHVHEGEKRYACEFCARPFAHRAHLTRHIKRIHK